MPIYKDKQNKLHSLDSEEFSYLLPEGCVLITKEQAIALLPVPVINFKQQAKTLLTKSDLVVLRCYESNIAVPKDWVDYRAALRLIVSGSSTVIPEMPEYPQ